MSGAMSDPPKVNDETSSPASEGPLPFPLPDKKLLGIIICGTGAVCLLFLLIALPTKGWVVNDTTKLGLSEYEVKIGGSWYKADNSGEAKKRGDAAMGLLSMALIFVACGIALAVLFLILDKPPFDVPVKPSLLAIVGFALSFLAWLFEMSGWANWCNEYDKDLSYSFALAILAWLLHTAWLPLWGMAYLKLKAEEESGADENPPAVGDTQQNPVHQEPAQEPEDNNDVEAGVVASLGAVSLAEDEEKCLEYHDYDVDDEGSPVIVTDHVGQFRCAGDAFMEFGFQLTANPNASDVTQQQGHFMCLVEFESEASEITASFEYNMCGDPKNAGAGLCAYILDPTVPGWDTKFNGTGPMGFLGKTGAIVGAAFDNTGVFTGGDEFADHVTIKGVNQPPGKHLKTKKVDGGFMTGEEDWRSVTIKFDINDMNCDVKLDDEKILDDIDFGDIKIPSKLCVAVCGAASNDSFMIAVNDVKLVDEDQE